MNIEFDIPNEGSSIIKVIGIGGGGGNAVNHMFRQGIEGVDFIICNTDQQSLDRSPVPTKVQIGDNLTAGRGAGANPEVGRKAAIEGAPQIQKILEANTRMLFITAGMGGGTGTGAAPIVAQMARELGILTVAIVTKPFAFEGPKRIAAANEGIAKLKEYVDTILIVDNEKLKGIYGKVTINTAFSHADNILTTAAKGIAEIITLPGYINVDFEDVKTVIQDSGAAIMGCGMASGEDRAINAIKGALDSPLLQENDIEGANRILINITSGMDEMLLEEISTITDYVQEMAGMGADVIWGQCEEASMGDKVMVTVIATGFEGHNKSVEEKVILNLGPEPAPVFKPETLASNQAHKEDENSFYNSTNIEKEQVAPTPTPVETPKHFIPTPINTTNYAPPSLFSNEPTIKPSPAPAPSHEEETDMYKKIRLEQQRNSFNNLAAMEETENIPAYIRRKIQLEPVPHSSENEFSGTSVGDGSDGRTMHKTPRKWTEPDVD